MAELTRPSSVSLGPPVQIAYAVGDVRTAAARWVDRGAGPFFVRDHIPVSNARVFGAQAEFDHSSAYGQWGDVMIELICEHLHDGKRASGQGPLVGVSGVHHMAFFVDAFADSADALTNAGYAEALYAEAGGMSFGFFDARDELGHFIEIYERPPRLAAFYAMVRDAASEWDGTNPVRTL